MHSSCYSQCGWIKIYDDVSFGADTTITAAGCDNRKTDYVSIRLNLDHRIRSIDGALAYQA